MATQAPEETKVSTRDYRTFQQVTLDFSDPVEVSKLLDSIRGDSKELVVLVKLENVNAGTNRKAIDALADERELDGDYSVVAETAISDFKNVKTKTKRAVSIG